MQPKVILFGPEISLEKPPVETSFVDSTSILKASTGAELGHVFAVIALIERIVKPLIPFFCTKLGVLELSLETLRLLREGIYKDLVANMYESAFRAHAYEQAVLYCGNDTKDS